jgi:serine/threonine protein kinase
LENELGGASAVAIVMARYKPTGRSFLEGDARGLVVSFLRTCAAIHDRNILHCDLKLSNLVLGVQPDGTHIRVVDWGSWRSQCAKL